MDVKAKITLALLAGAALAGTALGLGVGRPPRRENPGVTVIREESRYPGRRIFTENRCVVCHGADGSGGEMGPALGAIMPEYLAQAGGDVAEAKRRLVAYLKEPQTVPVLRKEKRRYPNPMPSAQGLGLSDADVEKVAEWVIHLKPPLVNAGGDASGGR